MIMTRRRLLSFSTATLALAAVSSWVTPTRAQQGAGADAGFVQSFGDKLVAVVNGSGSASQKEQELRPLIDGAVDVNTIAQFCLGRFATTATPQQVQEFTQLFHGVLVNNITAKIGDYRGVTFHMTPSSTTMRGSEAYVATVVQRPNDAPINVSWVVSNASGSPKIVDVVAEGTSLRLTQRSDYASYLNHNGNNIDSLLSAMRRQVASGT